MRIFLWSPQRATTVLWISAATTRAFSSLATTTISRRSLSPFVTSLPRFMSSSSATNNADDKDEVDLSTLRVALLQFLVTPDQAHNHDTCLRFCTRAAQEGAQLLVLPEIWASPYATAAFRDYAQALPDVGATDLSASGPSARLLQEIAVAHKVWLVGGSVVERKGKDASDDDNDDDSATNIYNTCLVFNPEGKVVAKHRKVHLFDVNVPGGIYFQESATLSPGDQVSSFDTPWGTIGVGICYDMRFAAYALRLRHAHQAKILIYPGAFNLTTGPAHWELLQRARAVDTQCFVLTASPARAPPESLLNDNAVNSKYPPYTAWGHSTAVSPWAEVLATTDEREDIVRVDLDMIQVDRVRQAVPLETQLRPDLYSVGAADMTSQPD
jgi:omega-amidase